VGGGCSIQHREGASVTTGRSRTVIIAVALVLAHAALGGAQEFEPRAYTVAPVGLNFLAVGCGYGGRTTVNGVPRATVKRNWRLALIVAYPFTPTQGVSVSLNTGGNLGAGTDADAIVAAYQFAWGNG
jgi:hypothetical protein